MTSMEGAPDLHGKHMAALDQFDRNLDAMMHPVSREGLRDVTWKLLIGMFDYAPNEASARIAMLDESGNMPTEKDLELDAEAGPELLRTCLFDELAEDYYIQFGKEEFDRWIEPFLRSVLQGHLEETPTYEHTYECLEDPSYENPGPFCPAVVMRRMVKGELCEGDTPVEQNIGYLSHSSELVYVNATIVRTLQKLGIYSKSDTEEILDKYMWWLESSESLGYPLKYDEGLFKA